MPCAAMKYVHEDIICIHTNEDVALYCRVIVLMAYQTERVQSNYGLFAYIYLADHDHAA